jgi:hypothetical protein
MAAKKTAPKKAAAAAPKKAAPKKAAPKKTAATPTTAKATKPAAPKKAAPKKAAIKVNDAQLALLKTVEGKGEGGHFAEKGEGPKLTALATKKLLKAAKKDKATGKAPYVLTAAGKKYLASSAATPTS